MTRQDNAPIMIDSSRYPQLARIDSPVDLRALDEAVLPSVAGELRAYLIETVARIGGHFAAGLGVIELTCALHYLYDTPNDRLIWDVGHQCYPHKILTGRRDRIHTVKQKDGLAPFPQREESAYDSFGVGHSSTSISAALGMALALRLGGAAHRVVAVIGDGAMSAGMAFEALNHAGGLDPEPNLLVILNDNRMSISENVGALARMLGRLSGAEHGSTPPSLFTDMGFHYTGPVDGHDLPALLRALRTLRQLKGLQLLHVITTKGKGYVPAEGDQIEYHAVGPFDPGIGIIRKTLDDRPGYSQVFGDWLCDMAASDPRLIGITPAMREGSGLVRFSQEYPDRYFDVAIAEQHAVTLAAGMACEGAKPVLAIYSTFLQRGHDQLIHDVAIQNLDVLFAIDRAGLVGPDGATHAGSFDLSCLRCIPNLVLMAPSNENECRRMLSTGFLHQGPAAVRYPRGIGPGMMPEAGLEPLHIGKANVRRRGRALAILSFGALLPAAEAAGCALDLTVVDMRFVKPLDHALLLELARQHEGFVTLEDNVIAGGAGSGVAEFFAAEGIVTALLQLGLPDAFLPHAGREQLLAQCGLDSAGVQSAILRRWPKLPQPARATG